MIQQGVALNLEPCCVDDNQVPLLWEGTTLNHQPLLSVSMTGCLIQHQNCFSNNLKKQNITLNPTSLTIAKETNTRINNPNIIKYLENL